MTAGELIAQVEKAFAGVTLEDGVGLFESQGLDDRLTSEQCAALRARDEKEDWHTIAVLDLYRCGSCLHYFDAKGTRFHLPQIMLHCLGAYDEEDERLGREGLLGNMDSPDLHFHLTYLDRDNAERSGFDRFENYFSALNAAQTACVIGFLEYIRDNADELYTGLIAKEIMHRDVLDIEMALPVWRARLSALESAERASGGRKGR